MRRLPIALALFLASCAGLPPLAPPAEDAAACAAAHAAAAAQCRPDDADPLAREVCADALRVAVRSCRAAALTAPR